MNCKHLWEYLVLYSVLFWQRLSVHWAKWQWNVKNELKWNQLLLSIWLVGIALDLDCVRNANMNISSCANWWRFKKNRTKMKDSLITKDFLQSVKIDGIFIRIRQQHKMFLLLLVLNDLFRLEIYLLHLVLWEVLFDYLVWQNVGRACIISRASLVAIHHTI